MNVVQTPTLPFPTPEIPVHPVTFGLPPLPLPIPITATGPIPIPPTTVLPAPTFGPQPVLTIGQPAYTLPVSPTGYSLLPSPDLSRLGQTPTYIPPQIPVIATPREVFSFDPTSAVITGSTPSAFAYSPPSGYVAPPPPPTVVSGTITYCFDPFGSVYPC